MALMLELRAQAAAGAREQQAQAWLTAQSIYACQEKRWRDNRSRRHFRPSEWLTICRPALRPKIGSLTAANAKVSATRLGRSIILARRV